jgi:Flp pilus assembly protein TadG
MATAEMAVALPVLMLLVLTAVYAVQVAGMRVRCLDAAREAARAAARDDPRATAIARRVLPGAEVSITRSATTVSAIVTIHLAPLGRDLPAVTIREQVTAATEPDPAGAVASGRGGIRPAGASPGGASVSPALGRGP